MALGREDEGRERRAGKNLQVGINTL